MGLFDRIVAFGAMIRDSFAKRYKPRARFYVAVIGAILYFIFPLDALPDMVPLVGFIDDVSVLGLCGKVIWDEVNLYLQQVEASKGPEETQHDNSSVSANALPPGGGNPEG